MSSHVPLAGFSPAHRALDSPQSHGSMYNKTSWALALIFPMPPILFSQMLFPKSLFSLESCRIGAMFGYLLSPSLHGLSVHKYCYAKTIQQCSFPLMCCQWHRVFIFSVIPLLCINLLYLSSSLNSTLSPPIISRFQIFSLSSPILGESSSLLYMPSQKPSVG